VLIYDGDCGFCKYWARYWERLTGTAVRYAPYQHIATDYPHIPLDEFRRAVQYVSPEGTVASAAEASFRTLTHAPGKSFWLWLYRHVPGFAPASELVYAFLAAHRPAAYWASRALWGREATPPRHFVVAWLFQRGLALIYLAAFFSFAVQAPGLIGERGILPIGAYLNAVAGYFGIERFWLFPTLFWIDAGNTALAVVSWGGALCAALLLLGFMPRLMLALLYALYLALFYAGQTFMTFQWDLLLLEMGFLALVMAMWPTLGIWLARWLAFRFMFESGLVKLLSGDASWWDLSALEFHFQSQPLPTPLAWYAHHLPPTILGFATAVTLVIETLLPLLIFLPRRARFLAACGLIVLQVSIMATGNYNFFNLEALLLALILFDDAALAHVLPRRLGDHLANRASKGSPAGWLKYATAFYAVLCVVIGGSQINSLLERSRPSGALSTLRAFFAPFALVNSYGPFAVMTRERPEIIIEGSTDGVTWREYAFRYKPGDPDRRPPWNIPHQPRLDWQMWFAALSSQDQEAWFGQLLTRLLQGSPDVLALFAANPFLDAPPTYVRALLYDYRFSDTAERADGHWWVRRQIGVYAPSIQIDAR
jgi:predicted DCC family thiol-disulfide oxidoreductase YuxK/uncharacterized membrane protein YphA (DoxX/SURF4 family)